MERPRQNKNSGLQETTLEQTIAGIQKQIDDMLASDVPDYERIQIGYETLDDIEGLQKAVDRFNEYVRMQRELDAGF